ncbi:ParB and winged helix-turn-helix domain-containing protein [Kitasatospora sp. NPDC058965]|uniref:ParB and winged helix-turn-helix domain-containing protein n=1 Tax=Kitasatospora sp. NPDC058965 TaxID=3346682 RepID=UPI0036C32C42
MTIADHEARYRVPLDLVQPGDSPRFTPVDEGYAARLAATPGELPPILVHRATMRVIDGAHRLRAAELRGERTIAVEYFDGSPDAAFVRGVESKAQSGAGLGDHPGLPLSVAERKAAAERIVRLRPELSDRSIARSAGLSAKTVGEIRRRSVGLGGGTVSRLGRDGRLRPVNPNEGRRRVLQVISERPGASLREIAQAAGVSLGTAHGVRARIDRGEETLPAADRAAAVRAVEPAPELAPEPVEPPVRPAGTVPPPRDPRPAAVRPLQSAPARPQAASQPPPAARPFAAPRRTQTPRPLALRSSEAFAGLAVLRRDPSLKFTDRGRALLLWLHRRLVSVSATERELQNIPPHLVPVVADLALECAAGWRELAEQLHRRGAQSG